MSTCVARADACASDSPLAATALAVATKPRRERSGLAVGATGSGFASLVTGGLLADFLKRGAKASLYGTDRTEGGSRWPTTRWWDSSGSAPWAAAWPATCRRQASG